MAPINGAVCKIVIYKAVCKTNINHRAYIQKEELTGSLDGAADFSPLQSLPVPRQPLLIHENWKEESVTVWDNLYQNIAVHVLPNRAEIEKVPFVWYVKAQYVENVAANNA